MRRVWPIRGMFLPLVLLIAVSLVFIGRGVHQAEASAFVPTLTTTLTTSSAAGATSDISQFANFGTSPAVGTRAFPSSSAYFTPAAWNIPDCSGLSLASPPPTAGCPYAFNERTGSFSSTTTFGLLNSQCAVAIPVGFPNGMRHASTDPSDTIAPGASFANLNADVNPANGVPDGVEHWNTLLSGLSAAGLLPSAAPRERQTMSTVALGTQVWVDVLTYDPGFPQFGGTAAIPLGRPTAFVLQNANPLNPATPSLITDTCGLNNSVVQSGLASGGGVHRSNPASPGTNLFFLQGGSQRDADQGPSAPAEPTTFVLPGGLSGFGLVNSLDTCPFQPNQGSALAPAGPPFNGDQAEPAGDGIDAECDPNPIADDPSDFDGDGYINRQDNCPLVANGPNVAGSGNQDDTSEVAGPGEPNEVGQQPVDGGPASDSIGNVCDLNPTVPDGHFHSALAAAPVCVTGGPFSDLDGDGWCDATELGIGGTTNGTPEALAVPGSCSDGADNDLGSGGADLADTKCQLPMHDLSIRKLNGPARVSCAGGTYSYTLLMNNPGAADSGEISIYLDSQPSYVPGPGPFPAPGKSAGSVASVTGATIVGSGPINVDGDADVEWLAKAVVSVKGSPATTDIQFSVSYPAVPGCTLGTTDFVVTADLCHGNDVAPLGVGPLNGNCAASATSDGGQDRNSGNDIISKNTDAEPGAE